MDLEPSKKENWLKKHPIFSILIGLFLLGSIGTAFSGNSTNTTQESETSSISSTIPTTTVVIPQVKVIQPSPFPTESPSVAPNPTTEPSTQPSSGQVEGTSTNSNESGLSNDNYYTNSDGNTVHSPAYSDNGSIPSGATAQCSDGTYSFSQHRQGTCSHHGGVAQWL